MPIFYLINGKKGLPERVFAKNRPKKREAFSLSFCDFNGLFSDQTLKVTQFSIQSYRKAVGARPCRLHSSSMLAICSLFCSKPPGLAILSMISTTLSLVSGSHSAD